MQRFLVIGIICTLLLLNVGIAAAAGTTPNSSNSTANATPTLSDNIAYAIQTFITSVITPVPTPVPVIESAALVKQTASPATPAPLQAQSAAPGRTVNPVLQKEAIKHGVMKMHYFTRAQRQAAADAAEAQGLEVGVAAAAALAPVSGGTPDYFGPYPNYALSQLPVIGSSGVVPGTGIRKFVDTLPGLTAAGANNLGQYIPIAVPDTKSYNNNCNNDDNNCNNNDNCNNDNNKKAYDNVPAADYYEIAAVEWTEKMHSDIPPTTIRGYVQLETPVNRGTSKHIPLTYLNGKPIINSVTGHQVYAYEKPHFLGPLIIAQKDRPVRIKFQNYLPVGGKLSIPVDTELMGAGLGPQGAPGGLYSEQRATIHLHGGNTPWISDGTQHQWTVPAGEKDTVYPKGVSVAYVPDMDNGVEPVGTLTFYYTNQQSARLMFYHEHALGITRLGVMAGMAAGYIVQDPAEKALVDSGAIPANQIPLVIQDRTFVPDFDQMTAQDPTWNWGGNLTSPWPHTGDFWFPHVYMPAQYPDGTPTPMGRWDYGPWAGGGNVLNGPVPNPYVVNGPPEPDMMPGVPTVSQVPETFLDTPIINGVAYPKLTLGPYAYRFRILNAANERFLNLQLYKAASNNPMWNGQTLLDGNAGEVPMVPAVPTAGFPDSWPIDNRDGGVPDYTASGPKWIQIGSEGGFLPNPVEIKPQPIDWDLSRITTQAGPNVLNRSLLIGPAERADVIVDFSGIPDGTYILYNDAPAPLPGPDSRYDFYTDDPDQTAMGGAPPTKAGYGPNTRTLMQIEINSSVPRNGNDFSLAKLNAQLPGAYAQFQDKPIVPQAAYNDAFDPSPLYTNQYLGIPSTTMTFTTADQTSATLKLMPKSVMEGFDPDYGRITANFGVEKLGPGGEDLGGIGYFNNDPETEIFTNSVQGTLIGTQADGTQIWRMTHNGVDTHIVHVHMYNLQVINRVNWGDNSIVPPEANELGWKESVQINPLQDLMVAMRPITPNIPWELPNSIRPLNPTTKIGSAALGEFTNMDPAGNTITVVNHMVNYGWEYVWHCHLLGHEENDMMRSQSVAVAPKYAPKMINAQMTGPKTSPSVNVIWKDTTVSETNWTIQRASTATGPWTDIALIPSTTGPTKDENIKYNDKTVVSGGTYFYRVIANNVVGDTTVYPGSIGYPNVMVNSTPSNTFAVPKHDQSSIEVKIPNGGESWGRGTTHKITWTSSGRVGPYVKIELLKAGSVVKTIQFSTPNDGKYSWTIPTRQTTGTDYRIWITSTTNPAIKDTSNSNFTIK